MSNSNLYGMRDRRPVKAEYRRVRDAFSDIYLEAKIIPSSKSNDPDSQYELESQSFERGLRALDPEDRAQVNKMIDELSKRLGRGSGKGTAMQIIAHMGIFLAENGG